MLEYNRCIIFTSSVYTSAVLQFTDPSPCHCKSYFTGRWLYAFASHTIILRHLTFIKLFTIAHLFLPDKKIAFFYCKLARSLWEPFDTNQTFEIFVRHNVEFSKKTHSPERHGSRGEFITLQPSCRLREIYLSRPRSRERHCYGFGSRSRSSFVLFYINLKLHHVACDVLAL